MPQFEDRRLICDADVRPAGTQLGVELHRVFAQQGPRATDVRECGPFVADRHAQHIAAVQLRVGEKHLARPIDGIRADARSTGRWRRGSRPARPAPNGSRRRSAAPARGVRSRDPHRPMRQRSGPARCDARSVLRRPRAPNERSTIHSFNARNRRPSCTPVSIRLCTRRLPACADIRASPKTRGG